MLFNRIEFAIFFPIVYVLYWALGRRWRKQNALLFVASLVFYGWWDVRFLYLFILTTTVDFYCALMIARGAVSRRQRVIESLILIGSAFFCTTIQWKAITLKWVGVRPVIHMAHLGSIVSHHFSGWWVFLASIVLAGLVNLGDGFLRSISPERRRGVFVAASLISNLTVLGFFKYFNFFAGSVVAGLNSLGVHADAVTLNIILPVGISFYTFQSLAYTIDVYRRKVEPVERYLDLATCLSFFPLLVAGPIERPGHLIPQFHRPRTCSREQFREGAWLITWGLFKKMVVADNMSVLVDSIFKPYDGGATLIPHDGLRLLLGVYAFAFQIYGDFSGYTDIARGTARLLGFEIMENFRLPYFAISPSDFWQRWHISLSTWLRDYLYISLGGNRKGTWKTYRNLFLTMLLGGLWHGAAWTFVAWGAYHGLLLIGYRIAAPTLGERRVVTQSMPAPATPAGASRIPAAVLSLAALPLMLIGWFSVVGTGGGDRLWQRVRKPLGYTIAGLVMFQLTCLGWLLFRAKNMTTVSVFLKSIFLHPHGSADAMDAARQIAFYCWFLVLIQIVQAVTGRMNPLTGRHWFIRLNVWIFVLMSLLSLSGSSATFIYFNF